MKSMSIKQKILLILFLSFVILLFNVNSVFSAYNVYDDLWISELNYPEGVPHCDWYSGGTGSRRLVNLILLQKDNIYYRLNVLIEGDVPTHDTQKSYLDNNGQLFFTHGSNKLVLTLQQYVNSEWSGTGFYYDTQASSSTAEVVNFWNVVNNATFISTTTDIYSDDTFSTIFFQNPPVVEAPILEGTLAPIIAEVQTAEVMTEVVHLLPVILSVLVSLLALYKALKMLLNFLQTS